MYSSSSASAFSPTNGSRDLLPSGAPAPAAVEIDVLSAQRTVDIHLDTPSQSSRVIAERVHVYPNGTTASVAAPVAAPATTAAAPAPAPLLMNGNGHHHGHGHVTFAAGNSVSASYGNGSASAPVMAESTSAADDLFTPIHGVAGRSRMTIAAAAETRATGARPVLLWKTPLNTLRAIIEAGGSKCLLPWYQQFWLGVAAGAYIGVGALLSIVVAGGMTADAKGNPISVGIGLQRFVAGAVFPVGLMLVALTGGELCTGNMMVSTMSWFGGKSDWRSTARNLFWSYVGNLAGSLVMMYFFSYLTDTVTAEPWLTYTQNLALGKVTPHWGRIFLKAMACNVLVGLAIWFSVAAEDIAGKIIGIWWPIMTFVALGYEHSVANMFFIPLGMMNHAPGISGARGISVGDFIAHNLLPVTVGNLIGTILLNSAFFYLTLGNALGPKPAPAGSKAAADKPTADPSQHQQLVPSAV